MNKIAKDRTLLFRQHLEFANSAHTHTVLFVSPTKEVCKCSEWALHDPKRSHQYTRYRTTYPDSVANLSIYRGEVVRTSQTPNDGTGHGEAKQGTGR
jgi:oligoribonuclease (3'-5' exoribonuclease)